MFRVGPDTWGHVPPLPIISGQQCIALLAQFGYRVTRQKGSHVRLACEGRAPVTVPSHSTLKRGTLRAILRATGISVDELLAVLAK